MPKKKAEKIEAEENASAKVKEKNMEEKKVEEMDVREQQQMEAIKEIRGVKEEKETQEGIEEKREKRYERYESREHGEEEIAAIAKIYSSYNNTIIHIVDFAGNTIAKASGGQITKYNRLEASPTVAMFAAKKAAMEAKEKGITALYVRIRAPGGHEGPHNPGPGSQAALRSFAKAGMRIKSIVDVTPIAYGGARPPHGRRGRRV